MIRMIKSVDSMWVIEYTMPRWCTSPLCFFILPRWKNPTIRSCTILTRSYRNLLQELIWSYKSVWKSYLIWYDFIRAPQSHHFWQNRTVRFLYDLSARSYTILSDSYMILHSILRDYSSFWPISPFICYLPYGTLLS